MPLHPDAAAFLKLREEWGVKQVTELTPDEARAQSMRLLPLIGPGEQVASVEDRAVAANDSQIPLRIYTPSGDGPFPVFVYYHGGGWVLGNLDVIDFYCRSLTNGTGCVVVSVNYRHAPEHKFPTAPEDCYAATVWASQNAATFRGDASRLVIGGASAGGNLAAAVTLMARDRGTPRIRFQVLKVPVTNHYFGTDSYRDKAEGYGLHTDGMKWFWNHYLKDPIDGAHPYASPLRANLAGLPPAFVQTAEYDPLCDEGDEYAAKLQRAGVPTTHKRYAGMIHGYRGPDDIPDVAAHLRAALA